MALDPYNATPVVLTDPTTGARIGPTSKPTAGVQTSVVAAAADTSLLAANANRLGATIFNESTAILYLALSATAASVTAYSTQVPPSGYYELPFGYTGAVRGIWSAVNGNARITELT